MQSVSVVVSSVRKYELVFPLKDIIYSSRIDTLEGLLKTGYSVRALFETGKETLLMAGPLPHPWVGKVESGEISIPR